MRNYARVGFVVLFILGFTGFLTVSLEWWALTWLLGYGVLLVSTLFVLLAVRQLLRSGSTQTRNTKTALQKIGGRVLQTSNQTTDLLEKFDRADRRQRAENNDNRQELVFLRRSYNDLAIDVRHKVSPFRCFSGHNPKVFSSESTSLDRKVRTLVVNFDSVLDSIIKYRPETSFIQSFFETDSWPDRPNSTQRLNLANYQAFRNLSTLFDIDFVFHLDLPENISRLFDAYDVVIIMQAPNAKSKKSLSRILSELRRRTTRARVVFGTELTWFAELDRGSLEREQLREVYTRHTLLRHTARTDMRIYEDEEFDNSNIQEFEIGLDTDVIKPSTAIENRRLVLFVKAPEGRSTKKNDAVDEIFETIMNDSSLSHLELVILEPPYSTTHYWELLQQTRYLIFTSIGETFSYVLNDAKAAGVVSFFPSRMYENRNPKYAIDSYPDMPGRYTSLSHLMESLEVLENDPVKLRTASDHARDYVVKNFSVNKLTENWSQLIADESLNRDTIFLAQLDDSHFTLDKALQVCRDAGYRYLLPFLHLGAEAMPADVYSWVDPSYGVTVLRDFIYDSNGRLRRTRTADGTPAIGTEGTIIESLPKTEVLEFWRILIRVNKIKRIVTNLSQNNEILSVLQSELTFRFNTQHKFVPIEIHRYSE